MIELLSIILLTLYLLTVIWLYMGIDKAARAPHTDAEPTVSVIVPARDEEANIRTCLKSLARQDYPSDKFSVYVIDDRSADKTAEIASKFCESQGNFFLITVESVPENVSPKKFAINRAIDLSEGEIILTTDADCEPTSGWISGIVSLYSEASVGMVAGYAPISFESYNMLTGLLALDSVSLASVSAGSAGGGYPLTCTGRSLSYRRSAFSAVGGFEGLWDYLSGDDDLLLHKMSAAGWKIAYSMDPSAIVPSKTSTERGDLSNQRRRHASKGLHYYRLPGMLGLKIGLPLVYLLNLLITFGLIGIGIRFLDALSFLFVKASAEFLLLWRFSSCFNESWKLVYFPLAAVLHPFYIVVFGAWGALGKFKWKGRLS